MDGSWNLGLLSGFVSHAAPILPALLEASAPSTLPYGHWAVDPNYRTTGTSLIPDYSLMACPVTDSTYNV